MRASLEKIVSIGVKRAPQKEHKKIKILNSLCIFQIISLSFLILKDIVFVDFYLIFVDFYFANDNIQFQISLLILAVVIVYLQHIGQILFARLLFILICILYACIFSFIEPGSLMEQNFILIPIISLTFINNKWINITVFFICFTTMTAVIHNRLMLNGYWIQK